MSGQSVGANAEANADPDADGDAHDEIEDDDTAMFPISSDPLPTVEYHVLLSQTYQVPALYFFLHNLPTGSPRGIEAVYDFLVPGHCASELRGTGVMGGISVANHPLSNVPAFFVHPCRTAEAMSEIASGRPVMLEEYLLIWMGLIGAPVGFYLSATHSRYIV